MDSNNLTKEDSIFFMEMIDSSKSPNFEPKMHQVKPYYKIVNEKDSDDFKRFIKVYNAKRNVLTEREQFILDEIFGVNKNCSKLKPVAEILNISSSRVRQIRNKAERKITSDLFKDFKMHSKREV